MGCTSSKSKKEAEAARRQQCFQRASEELHSQQQQQQQNDDTHEDWDWAETSEGPREKPSKDQQEKSLSEQQQQPQQQPTWRRRRRRRGSVMEEVCEKKKSPRKAEEKEEEEEEQYQHRGRAVRTAARAAEKMQEEQDPHGKLLFQHMNPPPKPQRQAKEAECMIMCRSAAASSSTREATLTRATSGSIWGFGFIGDLQVVQIINPSAAQNAGIPVGAQIVEINGHPVRTYEDWCRLALHVSDLEITVRYIPPSDVEEVRKEEEAKHKEVPRKGKPGRRRPDRSPASTRVATLTRATSGSIWGFGFIGDLQVVQIINPSAAQNAGIPVGAQIVEINGHPVRTYEDWCRLALHVSDLEITVRYTIPSEAEVEEEEEEPMVRRESTSAEIYEEDQCPVCLEDAKDDRHGGFFVPLKCGHQFCRRCLDKLRRVKPFCPLCRRPLRERTHVSHEADEEEGESTPAEHEWNLSVARTAVRWSEPNEHGERRLMLVGAGGRAEPSHITSVGNPRIQIVGNPNITINGRRVENPQDCAQQ